MLIAKHCIPNKVKNYIQHVFDMCEEIYAKNELTEGILEAALPHPTHRVDKIWNRRRISA
jgi:hypothetical protein